MSRVGTMPTRSNSLRAMIENSASPLPEASAPTEAVVAEITPATGACTAICPPSGRVSRASTCPAVTLSPGIHHHLGDLQPHPLGPHLVLLARNDGAGDLDDIGETGFRGLEHGDRRALRPGRIGIVGGGEAGEENRQNISAAIRRASVSEWSRARRMVIFVSFPVSGLNRYQKADREPGAKRVMSECHPSRQADGLRQRRLYRQRNGGEFVGAGDMPRDRGID